MRDVRMEKEYPGQGLFRTAAMALLIGSLVAFVAMFWALRNAAPEGADVSYYLPWSLPYGIVNLLLAGAGVVGTAESKEKPQWYFPGFIVSIVGGALIFAEGLPIGIFLGNVEFCVSTMIIGACILAIGIVGLTSLKSKDQQ